MSDPLTSITVIVTRDSVFGGQQLYCLPSWQSLRADGFPKHPVLDLVNQLRAERWRNHANWNRSHRHCRP